MFGRTDLNSMTAIVPAGGQLRTVDLKKMHPEEFFR